MATTKTINKSTKSHGAMKNCINYVLTESKIKDLLVDLTGPGPTTITPEAVYQAFLEEKNIWGKDSGRMYNHNVISFHKDEDITPGEILDFGREYVDKWFPGYQTLISVHEDRDHLHLHMVTNTVSYIDGIKLHNSKKDLQRMKDLTDELCRDRGLTITEKGRHFDGTVIEKGEITGYSKDKYNMLINENKKSFVIDCGMAVLDVLDGGCKSREDFVRNMSDAGWTAHWSDTRKHITFENENHDKVRDTNLSKTFNMEISKEALNREFDRQIQHETESREVELTPWSQMAQTPDKGSYKVECALAIQETLDQGCRSQDEFVDMMLERGWTVRWTDEKKNIVFEDKDRNTIKDTVISKTFDMDIGKEALYAEFERQAELAEKRKAEREQAAREQEQSRAAEEAALERYYAEVEAAISGASIPGTNETDREAVGGDKQAEIGEREPAAGVGGTEGRGQTRGSRRDTDALIRGVRTDIARAGASDAIAGAKRADYEAGERARRAEESRRAELEKQREREKSAEKREEPAKHHRQSPGFSR